MKNQGISLISLIITIIVIIILAAIVIFNGLNAPNSANFAGFAQQVDNVQMAVMNKHGDLKVKHSISGDYRTDEQIYIEIARNSDPNQYAVMNGNDAPEDSSSLGSVDSVGVQRIEVDAAKGSMNLTLPKIRQSNEHWYVTKDGKVFNANGYEYDGKTYFTGSIYNKTVLKALPDTDITTGLTRATAIWNVLKTDGTVTSITES